MCWVYSEWDPPKYDFVSIPQFEEYIAWYETKILWLSFLIMLIHKHLFIQAGYGCIIL